MSEETDPETILQVFRDCKTIPEVNATAVYYARDVVRLQKSRKKDDRTRAIHIMNLAKARRISLKKDGADEEQ